MPPRRTRQLNDPGGGCQAGKANPIGANDIGQHHIPQHPKSHWFAHQNNVAVGPLRLRHLTHRHQAHRQLASRHTRKTRHANERGVQLGRRRLVGHHHRCGIGQYALLIKWPGQMAQIRPQRRLGVWQIQLAAGRHDHRHLLGGSTLRQVIQLQTDGVPFMGQLARQCLIGKGDDDLSILGLVEHDVG